MKIPLIGGPADRQHVNVSPTQTHFRMESRGGGHCQYTIHRIRVDTAAPITFATPSASSTRRALTRLLSSYTSQKLETATQNP